MIHIYRLGKYCPPLAAIFLTIAAAPAYAGAGGRGQPGGTPHTTITTSLTGPVATAVAIIAMFAAGAALVFGDEMSGFVKRILVGVMALSLLIFSSRFLSALGLSGFTI
jgi:type IV secretory pathway VirB2 component (pilin)